MSLNRICFKCVVNTHLTENGLQSIDPYSWEGRVYGKDATEKGSCTLCNSQFPRSALYNRCENCFSFINSQFGTKVLHGKQGHKCGEASVQSEFRPRNKYHGAPGEGEFVLFKSIASSYSETLSNLPFSGGRWCDAVNMVSNIVNPDDGSSIHEIEILCRIGSNLTNTYSVFVEQAFALKLVQLPYNASLVFYAINFPSSAIPRLPKNSVGENWLRIFDPFIRQRQLFMVGHQGTSTPVHIDNFGQGSIIIVLRGKKTVYCTKRKMEIPDEYKLRMVPQNRDEKNSFWKEFIGIVVEEGDMIYIPSGTPHAVVNNKATTYYAEDIINSSNIRYAMRTYGETWKKEFRHLFQGLFSSYQRRLECEDVGHFIAVNRVLHAFRACALEHEFLKAPQVIQGYSECDEMLTRKLGFSKSVRKRKKRRHESSEAPEEKADASAFVEISSERFAAKMPNFSFIQVNKFITRLYTQYKVESTKCICNVDCGEDCLNYASQYVCDKRICGVGGMCGNTLRSNNLNFSVVQTPSKGFGLITKVEIGKGDFILEYVGEVVESIDEHQDKSYITLASTKAHKDKRCVGPTTNIYIDACRKGNYSRFINHSCTPNAEIRPLLYHRTTRIGIYSLKKILPGEEITFSYLCGLKPWFVCQCGSCSST